MKTTDIGNKYGNFTQNRKDLINKNRFEDLEGFNQDLNEERIVSIYKPKERIFYYDNSQISMSFGQYNLEKCLIVQFILIILTACLLYEYSTNLDYLNCVLIFLGGGLDVIASIFYIYFLYKLKSNDIFNKLPNFAINLTDIMILINLFIKIFTIVMIYVDYSTLGVSALILFTLKFFIEFYFSVISVKLFMFCPCTLVLQEQTEKMWNWIKYYIFCCDVEEPENPDYTKIEDLESFY